MKSARFKCILPVLPVEAQLLWYVTSNSSSCTAKPLNDSCHHINQTLYCCVNTSTYQRVVCVVGSHPDWAMPVVPVVAQHIVSKQRSQQQQQQC
jgi:hypothetical protein